MTRKSDKIDASVRQAAQSTAPEPGIRELVAALGGIQRPRQQVMVGIRNIGGSTVGIASFGNEPGFSLHPFSPTDPNSMAIVSLPRWQQLRKGDLFGQGLIERYDDVLDQDAERAPEDKPHECHPNHAKNRIDDVVAFIEGTNETDMRAFVSGMTSENQLQRIMGAVDQKVEALLQKFKEEGDRDPKARAIQEIPVAYQMAERLAQWRLDQLSPIREDTGLKPFRRP